MNQPSTRPSLIAPLGGVVVGVAVFLGVNITIGRAIVPTPGSIKSKSFGLSEPVQPQLASIAPGPGAGGPYQTVCGACHQADGQGIPGAFPPVAGSEWMIGNPEVPVRIVLLGITGPIEVKGTKFNSVMPPPPGLNDASMAEAITYARTHFGNNASPVTPEFVKKVRESLAGRTTSLTAEELMALKGAGGAENHAAPAAGSAAPVPASAAAGADANGAGSSAPATAPPGK